MKPLSLESWGWFYLSTILDDFSRYVIAWELCTTMNADDVTETLELALRASGCDQATVVHRPRLLSDNGSSYVAGDLAFWLEERDINHVRGAHYHRQAQGKIERWHQTLKNSFLLENYYLPGDLEAQIEGFVDHYNHHRYHEILENLTHTRRRLLRTWQNHLAETRKDQTTDHPTTTLAASNRSCIIPATR